eukprot:371708_1
MDGWMEVDDSTELVDETTGAEEAVSIVLKKCPVGCGKHVRRSLRYGTIVNRTLADLEEIKRIMRIPPRQPLTDEERADVVKAMEPGRVNSASGHWFKCPKGHIYNIGSCGGAMQKGKCYECGEGIGGGSHKLMETNTWAPEFDGAERPAWTGMDETYRRRQEEEKRQNVVKEQNHAYERALQADAEKKNNANEQEKAKADEIAEGRRLEGLLPTEPESGGVSVTVRLFDGRSVRRTMENGAAVKDVYAWIEHTLWTAGHREFNRVQIFRLVTPHPRRV